MNAVVLFVFLSFVICGLVACIDRKMADANCCATEKATYVLLYWTIHNAVSIKSSDGCLGVDVFVSIVLRQVRQVLRSMVQGGLSAAEGRGAGGLPGRVPGLLQVLSGGQAVGCGAEWHG